MLRCVDHSIQTGSHAKVSLIQKCNYEENFSYGCYMEAAGGCPTPTRAVSIHLFYDMEHMS
jgi:hypothetical protein